MTEAPEKPGRLSLWMSEHGRPNCLQVDYRATGVDTADTWIVLSVSDGRKKVASIEVRPCDLARERYAADDCYLVIDHAFCVDWTEKGRQRLTVWTDYVKHEAADIAEFKRLKAKFGSNV